jgi:hypothetical protein
MKRLLLLAAALLLLQAGIAECQELDWDVTVDFQALPSESRPNLTDFLTQVKQYLNSVRWTREDFKGDKIKCSMNISFLGTAQGENHYSAKAFIGASRPIYRGQRTSAILRLIDDKWDFSYVRSQGFNHDDYRFDPLLSFLDFYSYIVLAYDFDTGDFGYSKPEAGSAYYQKALEVINRARASADAGKGWDPDSRSTYSRSQVIEENLNPKFQEFRRAIHQYYYAGMDLMYKDKEKGKAHVLTALERIAKAKEKVNNNSLIIRLFFETNYWEIADTFVDDPDPGIWDKLIKFDPAHEQKYMEYRNKKKGG